MQAEADKEKAEAAQTRNNLDNLIYQTEKLVNESGSKLPGSDAETVKAAVADAKKAFEDKQTSTAELKAAFEKLQAASHKVTEALYKAGAAPGADAGAAAGAADSAAGSNAGKKDGDDVIDADFKDVN